MANIATYKKKEVDQLAKLILEYPIVAVANLENMPGAQLGKMRKSLRGQVLIRMAKKRLIILAIEKIKDQKKGIEDMEKYLEGMPALLLTKDNPFRMFRILEKNKSKAPAKVGQKSPREIIIPKGPTSFTPGPIISELAQVGIKAGVEAGKIAIKEDKVVAKEGQVFDQKTVNVLSKFNILPMEIGINLTAAFENGTIYNKGVLAIDEAKYQNDVENAVLWAFNLAVDVVYLTSDTTDVIIGKAFRESKAVAMEANILTDATSSELIERAERQMAALQELVK